MPGAFLCCLVPQAHRGTSLTGVLLCSLVHQSLKQHPGWVLLCSSVHHAFDGPASLFSCLMLAGREREAMVMAPPPMLDSVVSPCFHGCWAFLHRHFPPQSLPSCLLSPFLHSQQQPLPWDSSTIPVLQILAAAPSRTPVSLSRACMAVARTV